MILRIVLVEPEIPQNTGNIARTCAATGSVLHLVKPLGFSTDDRSLKRAGLDYWNLLEVVYHESLEEFLREFDGCLPTFVTRKAAVPYTSRRYGGDCALIFGKESTGLPDEVLECYGGSTVRIPMVEGARSLNLSNAVAIMAYEVLRQWGFPGLAVGCPPQ